MIYLSMDIDWAPDWAIRRAVDVVLERGLSVTLFVTHESAAIRALEGDRRVELAWHPNYLPGSDHGATPGEVLDTMAALCPGGRGVRAHHLWRGTSYVVEYGRRGLVYEASDLLFLQPGLVGGRYWNGVAQLPLWWEDDVHMLHGRPMRLDQVPLDLAPPLAVFDFHPTLLALNSADLEGYGRLKAWLGSEGRALHTVSEEEMGRFADRGHGDRTLLEALCDWCAARPAHGRRTLSQAAGALP